MQQTRRHRVLGKVARKIKAATGFLCLVLFAVATLAIAVVTGFAGTL
jgi:hypothetical protein